KSALVWRNRSNSKVWKSPTELIEEISISLFFFNGPSPTDIYTLSLHDALPILVWPALPPMPPIEEMQTMRAPGLRPRCNSISSIDRKSTRLNSSHDQISYAVFCLKKKNIEADADAKGRREHGRRDRVHRECNAK